MRSFLRRAGWLFLAVLFLGTGLGVGVWAFWQATHQKEDSSQVANKPQGPTLQGTKLSDFTPIDRIDSLQKTDIKAGDGAEAKPDSTVTVHYTGAVAATGVIFQSSLDSGQPVSFGLNQVIKGWVEGVPGMKVNGQRRLLIPADLAYGANPPPGSNIPANADLVFDITLLDVK
ncbi:FKBP-type peptidyl-prolyl cis-trans isomerase [Candidatus Saccharibacteria bacterium]|nr:FKBP-type peptidyl-prolyl cis-trans isomerase [Candidatus Saccharibacteria bacterium]